MSSHSAMSASALHLAQGSDVGTHLPEREGQGSEHGAPVLKSEPKIAVRERVADKAENSWLADSFARTPALMFALVAVILAPLLAVAGLMLRRPLKSEENKTRVVRRSQTSSRPTTFADEEDFAWPAKAWVEVEGAPGGRHEIGHGMVRIGRDDDNEIRLAAKTVHRTHAVVHRTPDADFIITDVSGSDGNGVLLNGNRVSEARLNHGDRIELGEVALKFISQPS